MESKGRHVRQKRLSAGVTSLPPVYPGLPEGRKRLEMPAFTILKRRWVVERTFAWLDGSRRLSKDYEYLPESSEAMIQLAIGFPARGPAMLALHAH
jgi:hypothetical protein